MTFLRALNIPRENMNVEVIIGVQKPEMVDAAKLAVFSGSLLAGVVGSAWLWTVGKPTAAE